MKTTERSAPEPSAAGRLRLIAAAALLAAALLALLGPAPALAASPERIGGATEPPASLGPGGLSVAEVGLAVSDREAGDVYVLDRGQNQRVDVFTPEGEFAFAFGWGIVPGAVAGTGDLTAGSPLVTDVHTSLGAFGTGSFQHAGKFINGPGLPPGTQIVNVTPTQLELSKPAEATEPGAAIAVAAGPGNVPVDEVQRLTVAAIAGEFKLSFTSPLPDSTTFTTTPISATATHGEVQSALEALPDLGAGNISVSGGPGDGTGAHPYLIEFTGRYADTDVRRLAATDLGLSGGSPSTSLAVTTPTAGAGTVETCTTVCMGASAEENAFESGNGVGGSAPGQFNSPDAIAVDNSCAEQQPPLTGSACESFDPSYGDVYVVDQSNYRVEKYGPQGEFLLSFGGAVNKTAVEEGRPTAEQDLCTKANLEGGDECGAGVPGVGPSQFYREAGEAPLRAWAGAGNNSIAIASDGGVLVGDYGRIQEFEPSGAFAGEFQLPDSEPQFVGALALDRSGDIFERSATYRGGTLRGQVPGVREFSPAHALLRTFDAEPDAEPTYIATDAAGDLFVTDFGGREALPPCGESAGVGVRQISPCPEAVFRAFKPSGELYAELSSPQAQIIFSPPGSASPQIAVGEGAGQLYASSQYGEGREGGHVAALSFPAPGPPQVGEGRVGDLEPTTATLHAVVNPEQFDTEYHFEYTTTNFAACGEPANPACHTVVPAEPDLGSVSREDPVQAAISGLAPATAYHWRVVATNHCHENSELCEANPEQTFETLPQVSVRNLTTQTVAPELVLLKAELDNNNSLTAGHWKICIGEDTTYATGCKEGGLKAGSSSFEPIEATFTGLQPDTTYHYQLLAHNSYSGEVHTPDQAFTTEPSAAEERAAEECPANGTVHGASGGSTLREQNNSTALPDCRAYEQVSPADKNGYDVSPLAFLAPAGERVAFTSKGLFAGATATQGFSNEYLGHRTAAGWLTQPVLAFPAGPDFQPTFYSFSAELDSWLLLLSPGRSTFPALQEPSGVLYRASADGSYRQLAPTISSREGLKVVNDLQPIAESADFSRLYFAGANRLLESDPLPGNANELRERLYELSGAGGPSPTLSLLAENPANLTPAGGFGAGNCAIDFSKELEPRWSSADGSTAFYTAPLDLSEHARCETGGSNETGPNKAELFACTAEAGSCLEGQPGYRPPVQLSAPFDCSAPHPCSTATTSFATYDGASPDGRLAWFTTAQPLVDSDGDVAEGPSANDLYLARLTESGGLESLTQASAGEPSDPQQGVDAGVQGVTQLSPDGTHVAFVATGVLTSEENALQQSAAQGADNLYLYDAESGQTKFIARLCSGPTESGSLQDPACPTQLPAAHIDNAHRFDTELWLTSQPEAELTPDGRYLLFLSYGRLTPGDTDNQTSVFRYDFATGQLVRLSVGRNGNDANGNDDAYPVELNHGLSQGIAHLENSPAQYAEDATRMISADGSTAVFATAAPLASPDTNAGANPGCGNGVVTNPKAHRGEPDTGCDVYQWQEAGHGSCAEAEGGSGGCVRLISDGVDPHGSFGPRISSSGQDIVFSTGDGLVPADTDGVADIYDARAGGGFPHVPPLKIPCEEGSPEACHGESTHESPPPNISTPNFVGPGNETTQLRCAKGKHKVKKHGQIRCVAKHHKAKMHHKRANANRRAGK